MIFDSIWLDASPSQNILNIHESIRRVVDEYFGPVNSVEEVPIKCIYFAADRRIIFKR